MLETHEEIYMIKMIGFKHASKPYYGWEIGIKKHGDQYIDMTETFHKNICYDADCYYQTNLMKPKFNSKERNIRDMYGQKYEYILSTGKPFIVSESSVFREYGQYKRFGWWSYGWVAANCNNESVGDSRWTKFVKNTGVTFKDWRSPGKNIVIMAQKEGDSALVDLYKKFNSFGAWINYVIKKLRKFTDRPIVYRPHPMNLSRGLRNWEKIVLPFVQEQKIKNVTLSQFLTEGGGQGGEGLENDLKRAYCVVTYNSLSAVEAVVRGIPVYATNDMSMVWPIAHKDFSQIEKLNYNIDLQDWQNKIAYTMWNREEVKSGEAWAHLKPVYF